MATNPVIDYLKDLIEKAETGDYDLILERTEYKRKVIRTVEDGVLVEKTSDVDDSEWIEVIRVKKHDNRILS